MNLTNGQEMALSAIQEVSKSHPNGGGIVIISGFAGTGKTTLLRTLAEDEELVVLAPTGKAAMRAREVAPSVDAMTIHRWLYEVAEDPKTGKLVVAIKDAVQIPKNKTIFVDEASMVTFVMFKDLYKAACEFHLNLVFLGDGFQLPPVEFNDKYKDFNLLASDSPAHYRVQMTEVVRQALDNPIIRASMELRDLRSGLETLSSLKSVRIADVAIVGAKVYNNGGTTICHRNATRHQLNNAIRQSLGITHEKIQKAEPLAIMMNNYALDVYNGEIVQVLSDPVLMGDKPIVVKDRFANETLNMWFYSTRVETPSGPKSVLFADREVFGTSGKISTKSIRKAGKDWSRTTKLNELRAMGNKLSYAEIEALEGDEVVNANLGYALTCHRSQGSQYPDVLVCIEDSVRINSEEGRRWVYTSITRSQQDIKICWM